MRTANRVAVVTGGGSGIGQAIATHLGRNGRRVAVLDLNGEAADKVASELQADGGSAHGVRSTFPIRTPSLEPLRRCEILSAPSRSLSPALPSPASPGLTRSRSKNGTATLQ